MTYFKRQSYFLISIWTILLLFFIFLKRQYSHVILQPVILQRILCLFKLIISVSCVYPSYCCRTRRVHWFKTNGSQRKRNAAERVTTAIQEVYCAEDILEKGVQLTVTDTGWQMISSTSCSCLEKQQWMPSIPPGLYAGMNSVLAWKKESLLCLYCGQHSANGSLSRLFWRQAMFRLLKILDRNDKLHGDKMRTKEDTILWRTF